MMGEIEKDDIVECPICGKEFKNLSTHIIRIHKVSVSEFKEKFPGAKLVSEKVRKKLAHNFYGRKHTDESKRKLSISKTKFAQILNEEKLYELYIIKQKNAEDIAVELDCSKTSVHRYLNKFKIHETDRPDLIIGKKFGNLKVLKKDKDNNYLCECDCGNKKSFPRYRLLKKGISKSCGCKNASWKGFGEISGTYWSRLEKSAKKREYEFEISIEFAWNLFLTQKRKCALSGMDIYFSNNPFDKNRPQIASLDRIKQNIGYIEDNVQWVHKKINYMKHTLSEEEFIYICKNIVKHIEGC